MVRSSECIVRREVSSRLCGCDQTRYLPRFLAERKDSRMSQEIESKYSDGNLAPITGESTVENGELSLSVKPRFKRRTGGPGGLGVGSSEGQDLEESPVILSAALLKTYFNMPLHAAAKALGVCATAIKK